MIFRIYIFVFALFFSFVTFQEAFAQGFFDRAKELLSVKSSSGKSAPQAQGEDTPIGFTQGQIGMALKDALQGATAQVVEQLGQVNGFNDDMNVHIPLPENLEKVDRILGRFGMSHLTNDLELQLNRAAEEATPHAKQIFMEAIHEMSIEDAYGILKGPDDAATSYLRAKMGPRLEKKMRPIVNRALDKVGTLKAFDRVSSSYRKLPYSSALDTDIRAYALRKAMDGIFYYVAQEEASIRANPAKRSSEIVQQVFAARY